jgi:hypothetical protein
MSKSTFITGGIAALAVSVSLNALAAPAANTLPSWAGQIHPEALGLAQQLDQVVASAGRDTARYNRQQPGKASALECVRMTRQADQFAGLLGEVSNYDDLVRYGDQLPLGPDGFMVTRSERELVRNVQTYIDYRTAMVRACPAYAAGDLQIQLLDKPGPVTERVIQKAAQPQPTSGVFVPAPAQRVAARFDMAIKAADAFNRTHKGRGSERACTNMTMVTQELQSTFSWMVQYEDTLRFETYSRIPQSAAPTRTTAQFERDIGSIGRFLDTYAAACPAQEQGGQTARLSVKPGTGPIASRLEIVQRYVIQ